MGRNIIRQHFLALNVTFLPGLKWLLLLEYRQPGHFRSKKIFFVILFTNCLFLLPKVLYTKMTGRVYSFQNCRQNKNAWGFSDCNSRLKLKFEKMCFGAISLKKTLDFKWFLSVVLVPNPAACVPGGLPPPKPPLLGLGLDLESPKDRTTEQQNSH